MNPGDVATALFFIPYGIFLGSTLSNPLSGALSYLILTLGSFICVRRGGGWGCLAAVGLVSFLIALIVTF